MKRSTLRWLVFAAAIVPRLVAAFLTFGGSDINMTFHNAADMLGGNPMTLPYFRGIELWVWIGSVLAYYTPLPASFPYKLLPVVCDALIALILFDSARDDRAAMWKGLLYAIAPIPFIVAAMMFQWDSVWMYFLIVAIVMLRSEDRRLHAAAGAAFVLSVIAKPIAGPLVLLLLDSPRASRTRWFVSGAAAAVAVYGVLLAAIGWFPDAYDILRIFRYADRNSSVMFGLTYTFNRAWGSIAMAIIAAVLYHLRKISREDGVLLVLALAMAGSGLSPQYLAWVIPFAILAGRYRFAAIYTVLGGTFLVLFSWLPLVNEANLAYVSTFALLKPLGAWSPPFPPPFTRMIAILLGNYFVPLFCLGFVASRLISVARDPRERSPASPPAPNALAPALALIAAVAVLTAVCASLPRFTGRQYADRVHRKIANYDVIQYITPVPKEKWYGRGWMPRSLYQKGVGNEVLNIANLSFLWVGVASALTWRAGKLSAIRGKEEGESLTTDALQP